MAELDALVQIPGFSAELDVVVGRAIKQAMANDDRAVRWRAAAAPLAKRVTFSGKVTAAQAGLGTPTAFFNFDIRPQVGRLWSVRKVVVLSSGTGGAAVGTDPFAAALSNVTAAIFTTGQPVQGEPGQGPPLIDADQVNFTIPATQFYSTHQIWVRGNEWLVVGVQGSGVVAGLNIYGHARVIEIDDDPAFLLSL